MRTSILCAAFLGLFAAGCAGDLSGTGGGDDQQIPENCGNGAMDTDETCDDGNTVSGDGCSASCQIESTGTPRLVANTDKTNIATQLGKMEIVTLTLTGADGFSGAVNIVASAIDAASAPLAGVTVEGPATLDVPADGTAVTAMYTVRVATNASGTALTGMVKLDLTSSVAAQALTSTLNVEAIYEVRIAAGTGTASPNHPMESGQVTIKRGTKIQFHNDDTVQHITHGGPKYPHQTIAADTGLPGTMYEVLTLPLAPGPGGKLGCHNHQGDATYIEFILE